MSRKTIYQTLPSIKNEIYYVIAEEGGDYVSVNIFEWDDRDIHTLKTKKYFDVEINLFNEEGQQIDNWVTDIMETRMEATRRSQAVYKSVNRWFGSKEQVIIKDIETYRNRKEFDGLEKREERTALGHKRKTIRHFAV